MKRFSFAILFSISVAAKADCLKDLNSVFSQGKDYFHRGQYLLATQQLSMVALMSCSTSRKDEARVRWAQSLFELGEMREAEFILSEITPDSPLLSQTKIMKAWYERTLVTTLEPEGQKRFSNWDRDVDALPPKKRPWIAGTLSAVLPGTGQVYNGNYQSGVFSLIINALFLSATIELHNRHLNATAIASGLIFSTVYLGNIVSSVQSSRAINAIDNQPRKAEITTFYFPELTF